MTHTPEPAFRSLDHISSNAQDTSKLAALSARIADLEAQLYAVGAGGVGQSIKPQIQADTAPQPTRQPLTVETFTKLAHRMATKYTHRSDPSFAGYAFLPHTLEQFVRAIEAAHGITGGQP